MAITKTKSASRNMKTAQNTTHKKKNRLDCFDLLKMAGQQEADKKIQDVLIVSNLLANFQRLIEKNFVSASMNTTMK